jgi:hypothetical protein
VTFRRTRRTNDWLGRLTFGACLLGAVLADAIFVAATGVCLVTRQAWEGLLCLGPLAAVFTVVTGFAGWQLIRPQEWEFVVDDGVIRWGPTAHPERQRRVLLADVRRVVVGSSSRDEGVVVEATVGRTVGDDFVLIKKADRLAFVAFMKQHHPAISCVKSP